LGAQGPSKISASVSKRYDSEDARSAEHQHRREAKPKDPEIGELFSRPKQHRILRVRFDQIQSQVDGAAGELQ